MNPTTSTGATSAGSGTLRELPEGLKEWVGLIAAIVFLIGYLGISYLLFSQQLGLEEPLWGHAMVIFTSIESIALTAAGYLFGREVNRARAVQAEQQANQAQQLAISATQEAARATQEAAREAQKGRNVAETVYTLATKPRLENQPTGSVAAVPNETLDQISRVVRNFYP